VAEAGLEKAPMRKDKLNKVELKSSRFLGTIGNNLSDVILHYVRYKSS
jgi:hypothetical protein